MRVEWSYKALSNLEAIRDYIAENSEYYAIKFVEEAFAVTERLALFPLSARRSGNKEGYTRSYLRQL